MRCAVVGASDPVTRLVPWSPRVSMVDRVPRCKHGCARCRLLCTEITRIPTVLRWFNHGWLGSPNSHGNSVGFEEHRTAENVGSSTTVLAERPSHLLLTGVGVEKLLPVKFAKIKSRLDAL